MLILCVLRLTAKSAMISDDELGTLRSWKRREIYNWSCSKLLITLQIARFTASSNYTYKMGTLTRNGLLHTYVWLKDLSAELAHKSTNETLLTKYKKWTFRPKTYFARKI